MVPVRAGSTWFSASQVHAFSIGRPRLSEHSPDPPHDRNCGSRWFAVVQPGAGNALALGTWEPIHMRGARRGNRKEERATQRVALSSAVVRGAGSRQSPGATLAAPASELDRARFPSATPPAGEECCDECRREARARRFARRRVAWLTDADAPTLYARSRSCPTTRWPCMTKRAGRAPGSSTPRAGACMSCAWRDGTFWFGGRNVPNPWSSSLDGQLWRVQQSVPWPPLLGEPTWVPTPTDLNCSDPRRIVGGGKLTSAIRAIVSIIEPSR